MLTASSIWRRQLALKPSQSLRTLMTSLPPVVWCCVGVGGRNAPSRSSVGFEGSKPHPLYTPDRTRSIKFTTHRRP